MQSDLDRVTAHSGGDLSWGADPGDGTTALSYINTYQRGVPPSRA